MKMHCSKLSVAKCKDAKKFLWVGDKEEINEYKNQNIQTDDF